MTFDELNSIIIYANQFGIKVKLTNNEPIGHIAVSTLTFIHENQAVSIQTTWHISAIWNKLNEFIDYCNPFIGCITGKNTMSCKEE